MIILLCLLSLFVLENNGIPLWFRCFKGLTDPQAFSSATIIEGIQYVFNLFKDRFPNLIFLADRFFPNTSVMAFIDSIGCSYCFRSQSNSYISFFDNDGFFNSLPLSDINILQHNSTLMYNVLYTQSFFPTNLAISSANSGDDTWFILTNASPSRAIRDYSYRFGSIESVFKNLKSNAFYLESSKMRNLSSYTTLFGVACIALVWLIILGVDYSKNKKHSKFSLRDVRFVKGSRKRCISFLSLGLDIFNFCYNSFYDFHLKCNFILYDI